MQAEAYANTAHQLMLKYKDKKWYQFQCTVYTWDPIAKVHTTIMLAKMAERETYC